jgi:hypothetical protein
LIRKAIILSRLSPCIIISPCLAEPPVPQLFFSFFLTLTPSNFYICKILNISNIRILHHPNG